MAVWFVIDNSLGKITYKELENGDIELNWVPIIKKTSFIDKNNTKEFAVINPNVKYKVIVFSNTTDITKVSTTCQISKAKDHRLIDSTDKTSYIISKPAQYNNKSNSEK